MQLINFSQPSPSEITISDVIESAKITLTASADISPSKTPPDTFPTAIDDAVSFSTKTLTIPCYASVFIRNSSGDLEDIPAENTTNTYSLEKFYLDLNPNVKLYISSTSHVAVTLTDDEIHIEFPKLQEVSVGARSLYSEPAAEMIIPENAEGVATALPYLASSIREFSPERSYQMGRGHPPKITFGDTLEIPESVSKPETGITIKTPFTFESLYTIAPLVYYLGADVKQSETLKLVTKTQEYPLSLRNGQNIIYNVLRKFFFLDCLTRNAGDFTLELYELKSVKKFLPFTIEELYPKPLPEQVDAYMSVPFSHVERYFPSWETEAYLPPSANSAKVLPDLLNDVSLITPLAEDGGIPEDCSEEIISSDTAVKSIWFGDKQQEHTINGSVDTYQSKVNNTESISEETKIHVVCNDIAMSEEYSIAKQSYAETNSELVSVEFSVNTSTKKLEKIIASETDIFHYIGHIKDGEFKCSDGMLSIDNISVNTSTFILNGCGSYNVGRSFIDAGAVGGIVTLSDVQNRNAIRAGSTIARLLSIGHPLVTAHSIVVNELDDDNSYVLTGNPSFKIAELDGASPQLLKITDSGNGMYTVDVKTYAVSPHKLGSAGATQLDDNSDDHYYLLGGDSLSVEVTASTLDSYLSERRTPVKKNGELHISDSVGL